MTDQTPQEGELLLYRTANDAVRVEVLYESETFWLDQRRIAELFGVEVPTISYDLKEIYASGELGREATLRKILRVQPEGNREVRREIEFYNLDLFEQCGIDFDKHAETTPTFFNTVQNTLHGAVVTNTSRHSETEGSERWSGECRVDAVGTSTRADGLHLQGSRRFPPTEGVALGWYGLRLWGVCVAVAVVNQWLPPACW